MSNCGCGFSTEYPNCNGTHKVVNNVKTKIISEIEKIPLQSNGAQLDAVGMKILVLDIIKKVKGV